MAFIGHPILADIRKGMRLRPTQTVDKSRPMIRAEGESLPDVHARGSESSPAISPCQPSSRPCPGPPPPPPAPLTPCRPPPPPQPLFAPPPSNGAPAMAVNGRTEEDGRKKLLAQIRGGVRLRHVQTVDKTGLVLDEQEKQQLLRASTPNGSLDSQGKSPSPSLASACSSSQGAPSGLSPSPPEVLGWPSECSSPRNCSPSPASGVRHWPEVLTEKQRAEIEGQKNSDYQFDEQKQIEERQKEVAALANRGSTQSKIAAFRQLQGQPGPPPAASPGRANPPFCTLPRTPKAGQGGGGAQTQNGTGNGQPQQRPATNGRVPNGVGAVQRGPAAAKAAVNGQAGGAAKTPGLVQKQPQPNTKVPSATLPKQQQQQNGHSPMGGKAVANGAGPAVQPSQNGQQRSNSPFLLPVRPVPSFPPPPPTPLQPSATLPRPAMAQPPVMARQWHPPPPAPCPVPSSAQPPAPAPSTCPSPASFFRPYTPRVGQPGGAHRQNFERIRGRFGDGRGNGGIGTDVEEANGGGGGAEALWKEAAMQRKGQLFGGHQSPIPPPLPDCPPPPLSMDGPQPPDWDSLREQFKFAVDLDGDTEGKRLIRIVRR